MTKWQKAQDLAHTVWSVSQLNPSLSNFGEISQPHFFSPVKMEIQVETSSLGGCGRK